MFKFVKKIMNKKEYIICAAVWYKEIKVKKEFLVLQEFNRILEKEALKNFRLPFKHNNNTELWIKLRKKK